MINLRFLAGATAAILAMLASSAPPASAQDVQLNPGYISGTISVAGETLNSANASASGPNGATASASANASGAYFLTVNVAAGTAATFSANAYAYSGNSRNYFQFANQSVSVSPAATSTANFSLIPAYVTPAITVNGGTLSYAYVYAHTGSSYARRYVEGAASPQFPVFPSSTIHVNGTAYLTSGAQVSLPTQTISLAAGNAATVSWTVTAPATNGAIAGNVQFNGLTPSQIYMFASGPVFKNQYLYGNGSYSFADLAPGSYSLGAYVYYNNSSGYVYLPNGAFSPSRQPSVGNGTTTVNIGADAAFITGRVTLTGSKTNADLSYMYLQGQGVNSTASQGGFGHSQIGVPAATYNFVATAGGWTLPWPLFVQFYNPSPASYLNSYFFLYDNQQQALPVTLSSGQTATRDMSYATGTIALTMRSVGGATFSSPYLNASCRRTSENQTLWTYSGYAYGNQQNVAEASVTFVGLEGTCTMNAYASVNGSNTQFGQVTVNVVPGSNQVIDIGGPSLTVSSPAADYITAGGTVTVTGTATDDVAVASVTVNGLPATLSSGSGVPSVSFSANVALNPGANVIETIATDSSGKKGADTRTVYRDSGPPIILSLAPADGLVTNATTVLVSGTATDDVQVKSVSINGNAVSISSSGNASDPREVQFSVTLPLVNGENSITVVVRDETPTQSATRTVKVTKSVMQAQSIAFGALPDVVYGVPPINLAATASSQLEVTFAASGPCEVSGAVLTLTGPGTCMVTASQAGNDQFYAASDVTRSFTITAAPVAGDDAYNTNEDTVVSRNAPGVMGNDGDLDTSSLTAILVTGPSHGSLAFEPDGSFVYTPSPDYNGPDSFTYKVSDGVLESNVATVQIAVNAMNDAPVANNDTYFTEEDTPLKVSPGVLANDNDIDLTPLSAIVVTNPGHGSVDLAADGSFVYTPATNFHGTDWFEYKANDGETDSNVATVTIKVMPVNDVIAAVNDKYSTDEDTGLTVTAAQGVLANESDIDAVGGLTVNLVAPPGNGTVSLNGDGSFSYWPNADFNGNDTFEYQVNDNGELSNVAMVHIVVRPVNDAPSFDPVANLEVGEDSGARTVTVTGVVPGPFNERTLQTASLSAVSSNPAIVPNPTISGTETSRSLSFTPAPDAFGDVTITVTASDGQPLDGTSSSEFMISVKPVNDKPVASGQLVAVNEDATVDITLSASDVDSRDLTFGIGSPGHGSLTMIAGLSCADNGGGSLCTVAMKYVPAPNYNGPDSFTFTASDATMTSDPATVSIIVVAVNDAPVATNDSYATDEDTVLNGSSVLAHDTDVDVGDSMTAVLFAGTSHGGLELNGDGTFAYTPAANYYGPDSFTYRVRDAGGLLSNVATVSIEVRSVNDVPVIQTLAATPDSILENDTATLSGSFADPDVIDGHTVTINWGDGTLQAVSLPPGVLTFSVSHQYRNDTETDSYPIAVTVADAASSGSAATAVAVTNAAPLIAAVTGPTSPVALGASATVGTSFTDVGSLDTHTCTFRWGDGSENLVNAAGAGSGSCSASHTYAASNVYEVEVTVADGDGGIVESTFQYVVVYDPQGGFVTGGGWIMSPAGAYAPNPALAGKANFGFVSKYKAGSSVPTGNTEFQFKAADLNFKSTAYEWMVISGAKVRYRGTGTINGAGSFGFELTAWDGDTPGGGGGPDRYRLKIWDQNRGNALLYDNQMNAEDGADPTTALGGGSIVIHK